MTTLWSPSADTYEWTYKDFVTVCKQIEVKTTINAVVQIIENCDQEERKRTQHAT